MRIILLLFLATLAFSYKIEAKYEANYGWFGTIATATGVFEKNKTNYKITTFTQAKGIAAMLSKNMTQQYISKGIIKNNELIPLEYISIFNRRGKEHKRIYKFDYKNKKIYKYIYTNNKFKKKTILNYYAKNDVLSLYWNLPLYLKEKKKFYTFYALGGRKKDGRVDVTFPTNKEIKKLKEELFNKKGVYIKVNLYNKVFAGDKGILYLVINPKNWVTLAGEVKNVLKIGNLKGKIVDFKQKD